MPINPKFLATFEENEIFHIYNRTNNKEKLFLSDANMYYFLKRFEDLVSPFVETYCYNLLPNHFHFLIKVKSEKDIVDHLASLQKRSLTNTEIKFLKAKKKAPKFSNLIQQAFKRFFQSYALAFNKVHKRKGNLFYKPFKRVKIQNDAQLTSTIIYIHTNAAKHNIVKNFSDYRWSSWHYIISKKPTLLLKREIIDWFGTLDICIKIHEGVTTTYNTCELEIYDTA